MVNGGTPALEDRCPLFLPVVTADTVSIPIQKKNDFSPRKWIGLRRREETSTRSRELLGLVALQVAKNARFFVLAQSSLGILPDAATRRRSL